MKWAFLLFFVASNCFALTPGEKVLVDRLNQINIEQKSQLEDTSAKLVWTYKELESKQPQIDQITKERDDAVNYGNTEHEKRINSEKKIAEEKSSKLKWQVAFGGLSLLVAAFIGIKYFTPLGRFIP